MNGYLRDMVVIQLLQKVSFELGDYTLSEKGGQILKEIAEKMDSLREEYFVHNAHTVVISIKVIGYTDPTDFKENSPLFLELIDLCQEQSLESREQRRKCLNRVLSEKRAQTIGMFFQDYFEPLLQTHGNISLDINMLGYGEDHIPDGVTDPYPTKDERRRICKIYAYVSPSFDWHELFLTR